MEVPVSIPRIGIAGSYGSSIFKHLCTFHTVFHSGFTILCFHQGGIWVLFSSNPFKPLVSCINRLENNISCYCWEVISHCHFHLCFPVNYCYWLSFHLSQLKLHLWSDIYTPNIFCDVKNWKLWKLSKCLSANGEGTCDMWDGILLTLKKKDIDDLQWHK